MFFLIVAIIWHFLKSDKIDKIIFRGVYNYHIEKPFKKDTLLIVNNQKEIDTLMKLFNSAKPIKNIKPLTGDDELNVWINIYFYSDKKLKINISVRPQIDNAAYYYYHKDSFYEGYGLIDFLIKKVKS